MRGGGGGGERGGAWVLSEALASFQIDTKKVRNRDEKHMTFSRIVTLVRNNPAFERF